jgi:uncharacterized protein (DUF1800 family)
MMSVLSSAQRRLRFFTLIGAFVFLSSQAAFVRAALPEDAPIVVSEANSTRALVTIGPRSRTGQFARVIPVGGRATFYVTNLDLMKGEGATAFRADLQDVQSYRYPLEVLSLAATSERPWVYALTVRLHDGIGDIGDALVRITWRGMSSNRVRVSIGHEGGKIQDDDGSFPTPMPDGPIVRNQSELTGLPWSGDRVRFMMQAGFGANAALEARLRRISYSTWIEEQTEEKRDPNGDVRYSTFPYPAFAPTTTVPPVDCNGTTGVNDPVDPDPVCFRNRYSMFPVQNWFYREALYGEDQQLRRRVSWALSQIFVVGGRETEQSGRMVQYLKILDQHAFGNFRFLLRDVTLSPAMGNYLDMARSTQLNPNENYAREILQLFSVGVDMLNADGTPQLTPQGGRIPSYTQETVNNFTKIFTGWTFCSGPECPSRVNGVANYIDPMAVNPANHDNTEKVLFNGTVLPAGQTPEQDLKQALDNIFYHPNVGPFISKLLIQQMVTSNPTPAYVGRVAAVFNNNGANVRGDLKAVVRAILLDPEARGNLKTDPDYGHLREPVLFITNMLRPFNPTSQPGAPASCKSESDGILNLGSLPLDQDVFNPPSVFNYYPMDYVIPTTNLAGPEFGIFSTGTALKRPNFVNQMAPPGNNPATPGIPIAAAVIAGVPNPNYAPCGTRIDLTRLQNLVSTDSTGTTLIDTLNREMLHGSMSPAMRNDIAVAIAAVAPTDTLKRARTAYYLVATSPQFQVQR